MLTDSDIIRRHQRKLTFRLVPPTDWRVILRTRANVLVTGPKDALAVFVQTARSEMRDQIRTSGPGLPPFLDGARTLILNDVDALPATDQQRLRVWFDERQNADVQVISVTSQPLFELVNANVFDAQLYYRLNTIVLEIESI
jgi:Sigma-54 interaction domain